MDIEYDMEDDEEIQKLTSPGEIITSATQFMRGHGTFVEDNNVVASLSGSIERVNKLVSVRALRTRYHGEVGDLVVGRITEVQAARWKVDVNSHQDAILRLSSVNLPGGVQRRKLESDELEMRKFFEEGDLLVAEVQPMHGEGALSLHTRSLKYGKLRNGQLITVSPVLIRRRSSHFCSLPCGVDLILGMNGYIWIAKHVTDSQKEGEEGFDAEAVYSNKNDDIDMETRSAISRVSNLISIFARHSVPLTDTILAEAYDWAVQQEMTPADLLRTDVGESMVAMVTALA